MAQRTHVQVFFVLLLQSAMGQPSPCNSQSPVPPTANKVDRAVLEGLVQRIEPDRRGRSDRLPNYVDFFARELANDSRLFAFDVRVTALPDGHVELTGFVEFPETRQALVAFLELLGFRVEDRLETCPAATLGERCFGFVTSAHTLSYDSPRQPRSVVTDCLAGEPLFLLREESDHLLVHSGEGYIGYVAGADVHRVDGAEFDRYRNGPAVRLVSDYQLPAGVVPKGARLKWLREDDTTVTCQWPDGASIELPQKSCRRIMTPTEQIDRIVESAQQLEGTRYLWGGKSSAGIDCSGLVQVGFATAGLHLPRDSNQQVLLGQLTATRWHRSGMQRGDTLYFVGDNGKIRHTALYLGNDRFLHAVSPVVRINSFHPEHPDYDPVRTASFVFAKRLLE